MKRVFKIVLVLLMVLGLFACKSENEENQEVFAPKLDQSTKCKISVVGSYKNFEALEAEFQRFNDYYPDVELSYTFIDDYNNTISTVLKGHDSPNIFFSFSWMIGNSTYDEVFECMENLADSSLGFNLNCIRPGLLNSDSEGRVLTVPIFSTSYGMLVNEDLFKKEGLNVPTTYQELLDVCSRFKEKGYVSPIMGYSKKESSSLMNTLAYPIFVATLAEHPEMVALANKGDSSVGEYMRPALEKVTQLISSGCINLDECNKINDNYTEVILRFFEGDVPMMICTGDTVSGTGKRESQSNAFKEHPFTYSFTTIPVTDKGGYFLDSTSVQFSVNKSCENLDMTNEFMRFLISKTELNQMASIKRLITPSTDLSFDKVYAPIGKVDQSLIISPTALGIEDTLASQIRKAAFKVATGELTVEEAIAQYGKLK